MKRPLQIVIGLVLGAALVLAAQPVITWLSPSPPPAPQAVPDSRGRLDHIVVHYVTAAGPLLGPAYADLFATLSPDVRVDVAVEDRAAFDDLVRRLAERGVEHPGLSPVVTGFVITPWSRDRYTLARAGDRWLLVVPERSDGAGPERVNDWMVPWKLAELLPDTDVVTIPLRFDGGDLLVTDERVFASYRLVEKNLGTLVQSTEQLIAELEQAFGRPVFLFGDAPGQVPIHHIGMYLTPLPDGRVLIGDPELGLQLVGAERAEALGADVTEGNLARFRVVADAFEAAGFEVLRLPLLPLEGGLDYVTYNNVLLETRAGQTHVWVPVYGIPELDEVALSAYAALGITAYPVDVAAIYRYDGSVRCLVNVLRRL